MRLAIQTRLFLSHLLAVLLVSGSIGTYFYVTALDHLLDSIKARLLNSAALLSRALDAEELLAIRTAADSTRPEYQRVLRKLRDYGQSNNDIAFIYIMRRDAQGRIWFVVDSDSTADQALPGQRYEAITPALWWGFSVPSVDTDITTDEWGAFLSGFAPLKNGRGEYLVGLDMRANDVAAKLHKLRLTGISSLVLSLLLALLFSRLLAGYFHKPLQLLIERCQDIARGRLETKLELRAYSPELDGLVAAFNEMAARLRASRSWLEQAQRDLQTSHDRLERRVAQRTADLAQLNQQLQQEIEERKAVEAALREAARTDPLTGLLNRRAMLELLEYEDKRTQRQGTPFCIVLGDLDHFKQINDHYGHQAGDQVLREVAVRLRQQLRGQDTVARWGGEEFILLLPNTRLAGAVQVAEKLRVQVAALTITVSDQRLQTSLSLGVSECAAGGEVGDSIRRADLAMYEAKHAGRNRVVADPTTVTDDDRQRFYRRLPLQ